MRISDWSSDVCSSDLGSVGACRAVPGLDPQQVKRPALVAVIERIVDAVEDLHPAAQRFGVALQRLGARLDQRLDAGIEVVQAFQATAVARQGGAQRTADDVAHQPWHDARSEEHTSELQSLMRISYAVF